MSAKIVSRHSSKDVVLSSPITGAVAAALSDTVDLPEVTLALYVSVAGAVKLTMIDGTVVTYPTLTAGRHHLRVRRVWTTGTAATGIVAEY